MRAIAIASDNRAPQLPDVPLLKEQGVIGGEADAWLALFAPAKTPPTIVEALSKAVLAAIAHDRSRAGLPATCIDWGPWAKVGLAAARSEWSLRLAERGMTSLDPSAGIQTMARAIGSRRAQVVVMDFDATAWCGFYPHAAATALLSDLATENEGRRSTPEPAAGTIA